MDYILNSLSEEWVKIIAYSTRFLYAFIVLLISYFLGKYFSKHVIISLKHSTLSQLHQAFIIFSAIFIVFFSGLLLL